MSVPAFVRSVFDATYGAVFGATKLKEFHEHRYWRLRAADERDTGLANAWYEHYFTDYFGLSRGVYEGARVLDVGCGPRGTLEWATGLAEEAVGVDPLADEYLRLGASEHAMRYVKAYCEALPFESDHFDVVMTMNSLDHVEDASSAAREIVRVAKPGALILLMTEVNHTPRTTEPQALTFSVTDLFIGTKVLSMRKLEEPAAHGWETDYDDADPDTDRPGGVAAVMKKESS